MARSLASKPNVIAPGGDYPFGRIKNNPGDGSGTPVNEEVYGDLHQFFEKLLDDVGITANGQPENESYGFQYYDALNALINAYITNLKGGVPAAGDTLNKLYTLITAMGRPRGGYDASGSVVPGSADNQEGDFWRITVGGIFVGIGSGAEAVQPGDLLIAAVDGATTASQFYTIQSNVDQANSTTLGLVKLYNTLGASSDGAPTRQLLTNVDSAKVNRTGDDTMTGTLTANAFRTDGTQPGIKKKVINIGDWDMDALASINVPHGIGADFIKIRSVNVIIVNDANSQVNNLYYATSAGDVGGGVGVIDNTNIVLSRTTGGVFDSTLFDSTGGFNRGWVTIEYTS